jgi:POT family proton-dependent oligopeptide transporter
MGFIRQTFSGEGLSALGRLAIIYLFVAVFWSLWDQSSGGAWTLQARNMDLNFLGMQLLPEQVQTANPILILLFIPIVNYGVYPFLARFFDVTPLRRIGIGLGITAVSFLVIAYIQSMIDAGGRPTSGAVPRLCRADSGRSHGVDHARVSHTRKRLTR